MPKLLSVAAVVAAAVLALVAVAHARHANDQVILQVTLGLTDLVSL